MELLKSLAFLGTLGAIFYFDLSYQVLFGLAVIAALLIGLYLAIRNKKCSC